jgi:hypothetical protein
MTRSSFAAIFALGLTAVMAPSIAQADPADTAEALATEATSAGTAAGIVNECHSDSAPIQSAFMRTLDQVRADAALRQSLWQRYRSAEASTLMALAGRPDAGCADTNLIIQDTIHRLERPVS